MIAENKRLREQQDQVNIKYEENENYSIIKVDYIPVEDPDLNPEEVDTNRWLSNLKKDITLEQAVNVIKDMKM